MMASKKQQHRVAVAPLKYHPAFESSTECCLCSAPQALVDGGKSREACRSYFLKSSPLPLTECINGVISLIDD